MNAAATNPARTLFLAWQDKRVTRAWFPIGRLDVLEDPRHYQFRYIRGAESARQNAGFEPLLDFPDWNTIYRSGELFPLFQNRVMSPGRRDFPDYLKLLDLPGTAEPTEILSASGGYRVTDNLEVFPKLERREDGSFRCRFFVHGTRHSNAAANQRLEQLKPGEKLYVTLELTNPATGLAVQIQSEDYHVIGWAPRYLVADLMHAIANAPGSYSAKVVRVNPSPAPSKQRLLVEFTGNWPDYEPMSSVDFEPLVQ